jgi:hypothetical protein
LLRQRGGVEEAEQLYRDAVAADDIFARRGLVDALRDQGRVEEAEQIRRDAGGDARLPWVVVRRPVARGPRSRLATSLQEQGRLDEAEQAWRDAVAAGVTGARNRLAGLVQQQGRTAEAEQIRRCGLEPGYFHSGPDSKMDRMLDCP